MAKDMRKLAPALFFVLTILCAVSPVAHAQGPLDIGQLAARTQTWKLQIDQIDAAARAEAIDDEGLASLRQELETLSTTISAVLDDQKPLLAEVKDRLTKFGPEPASDAPPESELIAKERKSLNAQIAQIEGAVKAATLETDRIGQIIKLISERRRARFADALLTRTKSPLSLALWSDVIRSTEKEVHSAARMLGEWLRYVIYQSPWRTAIVIFLSFTVAIAVYFVNKRVVLSVFARDPVRIEPSALRASLSALWMAIAPTIAVLVGAWLAYVLFDQFDLLRPRIDRLLSTILVAMTGLFAAANISRALLAPRRSAWRVFAISDAAAKRLRALFVAIAMVYGANYILADLNIVLSADLALTVARSAVSALLIGVLLAWVAQTPLVEPIEGRLAPLGGWPRPLYYLLWAAVIALFASTVLGYIGLGGFLSTQVVVTGAILLLMYTSYLVARSFSSTQDIINSFFARFLRKHFNTSNESIEQIGLLIGFTLDSIIVIVGVPALLMQWGFQWEEIKIWLTAILTGFRVGNVEISLSTLITGLLVFAFGLLITRVVNNWVRERFISRMRLDEGIKNSINTGIGYFGFLLSAALGITYAGLDLSNLALIAGALSVGIGFGLQNIVNNFVSGIILLVERPVKVGDWIGVGSYNGFVKRISVRATVLETQDRQSVVVPNAELINSAVTNWMLKDKLGRVSVGVGVSYASDERQVRDILLEVARGHPQVSSTPAPDVIFTNFGDNSLDFELRVFLKDVGKIIPISSDLRFAIRQALREKNIEIPFPQRDIHIKTNETIEKFLQLNVGTGKGRK